MVRRLLWNLEIIYHLLSRGMKLKLTNIVFPYKIIVVYFVKNVISKKPEYNILKKKHLKITYSNWDDPKKA